MVEPVSMGAAALGAGIGAVGNIAGSWLTGKMGQKAAKQANQMAAWQQLQSQQWQEYMSNTAHQREVADLKAAGLNPVLSANSGASAGSGSIGNAPSYESADYSNAAKDAALGFEKMLSLKGMKNQTEATEADVSLKGKQGEESEARRKQAEAEKKLTELNTELLEYTKPVASAKAKAEEAEAQYRKTEAQYNEENLQNPMFRGIKAFSEVASMLTGPIGQLVNAAATGAKASALKQFAKNGEREANTNELKLHQPKLKKERYFDKKGKYALKEYEYE